MTEQELKELRSKKEKMINKRNRFLELSKKKNELETEESVKKYFEVMRQLEDEFDDYELQTEEDIMNKLSNAGVNDTNDIFIYMGTYVYDNESDIFHGPTPCLVSRDDKKAIFSLYRNIETMECEQVIIPLRDKFEKEHNVVFINGIQDDESYFYKLRRRFIVDYMNHGQEYAITKLVNCNEQSMKEHFLESHQTFNESDVTPADKKLSEAVQSGIVKSLERK